MSVRFFSPDAVRWARLAVVVGAGAVVLTALPGRAVAEVRFGAPRVLTQPSTNAGDPVVVMARNGRTAVFASLSTREGKARRPRNGVWTGRDPDHLEGPAFLPDSVAGGERPQAQAESDGTLVACATTRFGDLYTLSCALARPGHGFGAPRRITSLINTPGSKEYGHIPSLEVTALADGRLSLQASHADDGRHWQTALAFAPPRSLTFSALKPITTHARDSFTPLPEGGLLHTYVTTKAVDGEAGRGMAQVLAPHASAFGRPAPFIPAGRGTGRLGSVHADRNGVAIVTTVYGRHAHELSRVSVRRPGGRGWAAPVPIRPVAGDGFPYGDVLLTPDHRPLAISQVESSSETDCGQQTVGRVGTGPLTGARPELLSNKRLVATLVGGRVLDDGTVLVLWTDIVDSFANRIEYAVRPPHADHFGPAHPLPRTTDAPAGVALAANGRHLIAAWTTGPTFDGPHHLVVTTTRTSPPYAPGSTLPAHPTAPCN